MLPKSKVNGRIIGKTVRILRTIKRQFKRRFRFSCNGVNNSTVSTTKAPLPSRALRLYGRDSTIVLKTIKKPG